MEMPDVQHMAQGAPLVGAPWPARKESTGMKSQRCTQPSFCGRTINALMDRFPILNQLFDDPRKPQAERPNTCPICGRRYVFSIMKRQDASYTVRECSRCTPREAS